MITVLLVAHILKVTCCAACRGSAVRGRALDAVHVVPGVDDLGGPPGPGPWAECAALLINNSRAASPTQGGLWFWTQQRGRGERGLVCFGTSAPVIIDRLAHIRRTRVGL